MKDSIRDILLIWRGSCNIMHTLTPLEEILNEELSTTRYRFFIEHWSLNIDYSMSFIRPRRVKIFYVPLLFKEGWFAKQTGVVTTLWLIITLHSMYSQSLKSITSSRSLRRCNHPVLLRKPPLLEKEGNVPDNIQCLTKRYWLNNQYSMFFNSTMKCSKAWKAGGCQSRDLRGSKALC